MKRCGNRRVLVRKDVGVGEGRNFQKDNGFHSLPSAWSRGGADLEGAGKEEEPGL